MPAPAHSPSQRHLASAVRQQFVEGLCAGIAGVDQAIADFLAELMAQTGTQRDMQERRDAWSTYQKHHAAWVQGLTKAWKASLAPALAAPRKNTLDNLEFSLLSDDVVENKIIASRIALVVLEQVSSTFDALRLRVKGLEGELGSTDILRTEAICLLLVEQWIEVALTRQELQWVTEPVQRSLVELLQSLYQKCSDFLEAQGIAAQQDLRVRVQRPPGPMTGAVAGTAATTGMGSLVSQALEQSQATMASVRHNPMAPMPERGQWSAVSQFSASPPVFASASGLTPLARARQRAHGVMGQLRRFLVQPNALAGSHDTGIAAVSSMTGVPAPAAPASNALVHALAAHRVQAETYYSTLGTFVEDYSPAAVVQLSGVVRPPLLQGVIWSACMSERSKASPQTAHRPSCRS